MKITENKTGLRNISKVRETGIIMHYNIDMCEERRREYLKNYNPTLYGYYQMHLTSLQHLEDTKQQTQQLMTY